VFLVIVLIAGITVYFSYGFARAKKEMHILHTTSNQDYLLSEFKKIPLEELTVLNREEQNNSGYTPFEMQVHYLRKGESIAQIARKYSINFDTIISVNKIRDIRYLEIGRPIVIPNQIGVYYHIKKGDSMTKIAKRYNVSEQAIEYVNDLDSRDLITGEQIFIPGGSLSREERELAMGLEYAIPCVGQVVSGMGWRADPFHGHWSFHPGIDVAAPYWSPVFAGKAGRVIKARWYGGYGKVVVIQHFGGYQTWYGHLAHINVREGTWVDRNNLIGRVGSTGRSLGPHLHFEVRFNGKFINPFKYHGLNRRMWWR